MARITLPDGRWLDVRRMWLSDKTKLVELEANGGDELPYLDRMTGYVDILGPAIQAKSWDGSAADMPEAWLLGVLRDWALITEDDAFPPVSGSDSATTSPRGSSTVRRSRSRTPRSGSASSAPPNA